VTISSPERGMSPGMPVSSSTCNGVLFVVLVPYTTRVPTPYGWHVNSTVTTGLLTIHR
jgi:hypothetical protein